MGHLDVPQFLGLLAVILSAAKMGGALAQRVGQPAVLGELVAGVLLGGSVVGVVDPTTEVLHLLAELGGVILLFEIGLETDLRQLMQVGGASILVAVVGVVLPFVLGYAVCWGVDLGFLVAVVAGATLTATSVGLTARVLSDLHRLHTPESHIILGAAVIDDVIDLVILAVGERLTHGHAVTGLGILQTTALAFSFLAGVLLLGRLVVPALVRWVGQVALPGMATMLAVIVAFGLPWLASTAGSAMTIGAFAAGLLLRETPQAHEMERGVAHLGHFFIPLCFVTVGAAMDVRVLHPLEPAHHQTLLLGGLLIVAAALGKCLAGYAPIWFKGNKHVIGVGMIPRGEVGLIFAHMGLASGVLTSGLFSAVTLMVMATTFLTPPLLKRLVPPPQRQDRPLKAERIEDVVTEL